MSGQASLQVILVDDDEVDAEHIKRVFRKYGVFSPVCHFTDGAEALQALQDERFRSESSPFLILLDLNMPRMNGIEFLDEVRRDPALTRSIIFVLSTSDDWEDKCRAYKRHIAGYLVKSKIEKDLPKLVSLVDTYSQFVEIPDRCPI